MIPEIFLYEDGRISLTAHAFAIPEFKAILDKHGNDAEPYLMFVRQSAHPQSPYINLPEEEFQETIVYDIMQTLGDFDIDDELLQPAIDRFKRFYETPLGLLANELGQELHRMRMKLRDTPLIMGGDDDNFRIRLTLMEKIDKVSTSYTNVKEKADKELEIKMKGKSVLGEY